jgi:hypothetical protein
MEEFLTATGLSGINFIDEWRLGEQNNLPDRIANNKARNTYYFLTLLLGLLVSFSNTTGEKRQKDFWVVFLLFFMTGLAIVIYLNQYPISPVNVIMPMPGLLCFYNLDWPGSSGYH